MSSKACYETMPLFVKYHAAGIKSGPRDGRPPSQYLYPYCCQAYCCNSNYACHPCLRWM